MASVDCFSSWNYSEILEVQYRMVLETPVVKINQDKLTHSLSEVSEPSKKCYPVTKTPKYQLRLIPKCNSSHHHFKGSDTIAPTIIERPRLRLLVSHTADLHIYQK